MEQRSEAEHSRHRLQVAREWQPRQEFDQLCDWWRTRAFGVCVLEGMPGCGKTAIVDRFLRVLPGGYPQLPDVAKADLPTANDTFVFSFFDGSEDLFFADLATWLTNSALDSRPASYGFPKDAPGYEMPTASTTSYRQLLSWLANATSRHGKLLLVLDGMDRVQDASPGEDSVGRIVDTLLQNLVRDAADGPLGIAVVITTRYPLIDLVKARSRYLHRIEVAELSPEACCDLLRARGVQGSDEQLTALGRAHGFHAFSLDLLGGYIAEYCNGRLEQLNDPHRMPGEGALHSVVERYRQILSAREAGAWALLERLCLFRMGTSATQLTRLFLRKSLFDSGKKRLSGGALAKLTADALQTKLSGLARMRLIIESAEVNGIRYSVHPALRDVLGRSIAPSQQVLIHKAVLADAGIEENVEAPRGLSLDDLEGLIYHALGAGWRGIAWGLYRHCVENTEWGPQGYRTEERLCRAIVAGKPDTWVAPSDVVLSRLPADLTFAWGAALTRLGRLDEAAFCFSFLGERTDDPKAFTRLYDVWLQLGRIQVALRSLEHWVNEILRTVQYGEYGLIIPLAELLDELTKLRGHARALAGVWILRDWRGSELLSSYVRVPSDVAQRPITGIPGIHHAQLQLRLGRVAEAVAEADTQEQYARREHMETDATAAFWMRFRLLRAEIALELGNVDEALDLQQQGHAWAAARDANQVLCWSHLVRARIELAGAPARESLAAAIQAANNGLRLARSCGFALLHIDLLIVRAQVSIASGRPADAEQDLALALCGESTRPEDADATPLLCATSTDCGYAWGIVVASHWRGVACLLQAAQLLQRGEFDPTDQANIPAPIREKLTQGAAHLQSAVEDWKKLAESVSEDVDLGGATRTVLADLEQGRLPGFPLNDVGQPPDATPPTEPGAPPPFDVFLSYNSEDRESVRTVAETLKQRGVRVWFDEWEIKPGTRFLDELDNIILRVRASAVFVGASGIGPWQEEEIHACLRQSVYKGQAVIPVLLPNALKEPNLPTFLEHRSRVDLRTETGLDRLLWAIQGTKPPSLAALH